MDEKEKIKNKIKLLEKFGYESSKGNEESWITTPSGSVYSSHDLIMGDCPICEQYLRDGYEETFCIHDKLDIKEIGGARALSKLLFESDKIDIGNIIFQS
jgi:hypothetical protein